jgi:hypothetical protein
MRKLKFKKHKYSTNLLLKGKNFYISYNICPCSDFSPFRADNDSDETALIKDDKYYILNGDFRKQYLKAFPKGFEACYKVYKRNIIHNSTWTTR